MSWDIDHRRSRAGAATASDLSHFVRNGLSIPRRALGIGAALLGVSLGVSGACAQGTPSPASANPLLLVDNEYARVEGKLAVLVGTFGATGTWYGLDSLTPGSTYQRRKGWLEGWFAPGFEFAVRPSPGWEVFGGFSVGFSGTLGVDPFDQKNQSAALVEKAYAGFRTRNSPEQLNLEFSFGQQPYGIGTGMIVWQGAGNGFERGALSLLPRISWETAAIARATLGGWKAEAFYLDPNELPSANTGTRLVGGVLEYAWGQSSRIGGAYVKVLESTGPYPIPTFPLIIPNGRDGTETWHGYSRIEGTAVGLPTAWVRGEFALQRNDRIDMLANAWYAEIGNRFVTLPMTPALSYGYGSFSGDNPATRRYERFDPLYYGNGLENWWFGASGAYAFFNSNVNYHRLTVNLVTTQQDFLKFQYVHTRANELNSPLQFGQGARLSVVNGNLVLSTGVAFHDLADEIYAEWTHVWTPQITTTLWGSAGVPGRGITSLPGISSETWLSTGFIFSLKY
jgi:hypothetical protein